MQLPKLNSIIFVVAVAVCKIARKRGGSFHKGLDMPTFLTLQWLSVDLSPNNPIT